MTTTQRQRSPRRDSPPPGPNPATRGVILVVVGVVLGVILLAKGGGAGFDPDRTDVEIGGGSGRTTTTTEVTTTTEAQRPPSTVRVVVANGSDITGLAGRTAQLLAQSGYTTSNATDALVDAPQSIVYFAPGYQPNARAIATLLTLGPDRVQALSGQVAQDQPADAGVVVLLGADVPATLTGDTAGGVSTTIAGSSGTSGTTAGGGTSGTTGTTGSSGTSGTGRTATSLPATTTR